MNSKWAAQDWCCWICQVPQESPSSHFFILLSEYSHQRSSLGWLSLCKCCNGSVLCCMVCTKVRPLLPAVQLVRGCAQPQLAGTTALEVAVSVYVSAATVPLACWSGHCPKCFACRALISSMGLADPKETCLLLFFSSAVAQQGLKRSPIRHV